MDSNNNKRTVEEAINKTDPTINPSSNKLAKTTIAENSKRMDAIENNDNAIKNPSSTTTTTTNQPSPIITPPKDWDRCHVYIKFKNRFCRGRPVKPSIKYCGNHIHLEDQQQKEGEESTITPTTSNNKRRKRIPCPIDPSHYIFEDMLSKHIKICPKTKKLRKQEEQDYYKENMNCGGHGTILGGNYDERSSSNNTLEENDDDDTIEWAKNIALRVLQVHQRIFAGRIIKEREKLISLTFDEIHDSIPLRDLSKPELDSGIVEGFDRYKIKSGGKKHIPQLASLVGHLREVNALPKITSDKDTNPQQISNTVSATTTSTATTTNSDDKPLLLLEMGAGRGMFGLTAVGIARARNVNAHLVMVERARARAKADKFFRTAGDVQLSSTTAQNPYMKLDNIQWSRIVCDLSHVNLPVVVNQRINLGNGKVVVIAKHLCGAGMDICLKSLEPIKDKLGACVLATCCHGICDWKEYVGRDYLRHEMEKFEEEEEMEGMVVDSYCSGGRLCSSFGPAEFNLLRRWCAGTVANRHSTGGRKTEKPKDKTDGDDRNDGEDHDHDTEHTAATENVDDPCQKGVAKAVPISLIVDSLNLKCGVPGLGRACQRLFDYGRSEYMRKMLFTGFESSCVKLHHYVSSDVTPQNAVLLADTTSNKSTIE